MNSEQLRALETNPDWDTLTAYQRTLIYCREATRQGKKIPAWTAIREQVGKGSPADIRRAVADFRREQADALKSSDQGLAAFPPAVAKLFQRAWLMAIEESRSGFQEDREKWDQQLVKMHGDLIAARQEREEALRRANDLEQQLKESKALVTELMSQQAGIVEQLKEARDQSQTLTQINGQLENAVTVVSARESELKRENQLLERQMKKAEERIDSLVGIKQKKQKD